MNNYIINSSTLAEIGDTIRDKSGTSESIPVPEIPKHIENVYEAGKKSMVDESKLLPTTVSGSYIFLDDVSEVPHEVKCKISGVDNPQNIKMTMTGANLIKNEFASVTRNGLALTVNEDKSVTINGTATATTTFYFSDIILPPGKYTVSGMSNGGARTIYIQANVRTSSGSGQAMLAKDIGTGATFELSEKSTIAIFIAAIEGIAVENTIVYPMLNIGSTALPYEPYNGQTLSPKTDGTVDGITSVSPYMNIFTDTEGVNIEATYNKNWSMQEVQQRFCDVFKQETISHSLSFERLTLSKKSITSIINVLSDTAFEQTVTFKKTAKEAAFTDDEWTELTSTKPNWTFSLI